jgi:hypothetical protein
MERMEDIHDIHGAVPFPEVWPWIAAAVAVILAIAALWWWRTRRPAPGPVRAVDAIARERLEAARALMQENDARAFATSVSDTLRSYLESRYFVPVTHHTTEEFLRMMAEQGGEWAAHREGLEHFLGHCDRVKYARGRLSRDEMELLWQSAVSFVEATRPTATEGEGA